MSQAEEIKSKVDIVELIREYFPLNKAGKNFKGLCPFHSEKTPSFMVSPQLQIFKCFGCGKSGDVFTFLTEYEKMDFTEAIEFLAKRTGVKLERVRFAPEDRIKKRILEINHLAAEFYHFLLVKHEVGKTALNYLQRRGLELETLREFKLGFSPLKANAVADFLLKKKYAPSEILQSGLVIPSRYGPSSLFDRFKGRVVFPLYDHRQNIVGFSGRTIPGINYGTSDLAKYINTSETKVYHKGKMLYGLWLSKEAIKKANEVIVVEGEFDLISPWQAGIKNLVAIKGTAFTEDQVSLLKRFSENLVLALDADFAGDVAAIRSIEIAERAGLNVHVLDLLGKYKDPDEAILADKEWFKERLRKTIPVWDFIINSALKKEKKLDAFSKKRVLNKVLPFLMKIDNEVVKNHYLQKLARTLKVSLESVLMEADKSNQRIASVLAEPTRQVSLTRRELIEEYLVGLIANSPERRKFFKDNRGLLKLIKTLRFKKIIGLMKKSLKTKFNPKTFNAKLAEELRPIFEKAYFDCSHEWLEAKIEIELVDAVKELKKLDLQERRKELSLKIAEAEKKKTKKKLFALEKRFADLSRRLVKLESD